MKIIGFIIFVIGGLTIGMGGSMLDSISVKLPIIICFIGIGLSYVGYKIINKYHGK